MTDELNIPEFLKRTETVMTNGKVDDAKNNVIQIALADPAADGIAGAIAEDNERLANREKTGLPPIKAPKKAGKLVERALKARKEIAKAAKAKAEGDPKPKPAKKEAKPRKAKSDGKSKMLIVADLLKRVEGCTTADVLKATGWPTVSMPAQAKAAKLKLCKEKKKGEVTRYFGK